MYEKREIILNNLDEIYSLSVSLSEKFPKPEQVILAIYELLINAVEHGNLEIGFADKSQLLRLGLWETEVKRRLAMPEYANRTTTIETHREEDKITIIISDQGKGFEWNEYINKEIDYRELHGRGLLIVFSSGFNDIIFNEIGNQVTCVFYKT